MSDLKLIMENWRGFVVEQEAPAPAKGGSWPAEPPKNIKITSKSNLDSNTIIGAWKRLAAMNPPKNAEEQLAQLGGFDVLVKNVQDLEKNFAGAASNPARIDMPVVDPDDDMAGGTEAGDLQQRLKKGELDFLPPFAPDKHSAPTKDDFPRGLDAADKETQAKYLRKGLEDGDPQDDIGVTLKTTPINVDKSFPTQSAVYLDKSLWNILNFGGTPPGGTAFGDPDLIAIEDGDQNHILDGHHRWSSAWISGGPGASIKVQGLKGLDVEGAIAALRSYGNARGNAQKS